jgi:alpha-ribazole phosphatase
MSVTNFWLIRHALVEENARAMLYGVMDVALCESTLLEQAPMYQALAGRLPRPAHWKISPLSRTRRTAETIFAAGYPAAQLDVEPGLTEQSLGDWQGLPHAELPAKLEYGAHAFWPLRANERPPGGESLVQVIGRIGKTLDRLAVEHSGGDVVIVSHGGAIRAALAHAIGSEPDVVLHFSIQNLSLTGLERHPEGWRVVCVNELPGY